MLAPSCAHLRRPSFVIVSQSLVAERHGPRAPVAFLTAERLLKSCSDNQINRSCRTQHSILAKLVGVKTFLYITALLYLSRTKADVIKRYARVLGNSVPQARQPGRE
jgi:hypothetical protein